MLSGKGGGRSSTAAVAAVSVPRRKLSIDRLTAGSDLTTSAPRTSLIVVSVARRSSRSGSVAVRGSTVDTGATTAVDGVSSPVAIGGANCTASAVPEADADDAGDTSGSGSSTSISSASTPRSTTTPTAEDRREEEEDVSGNCCCCCCCACS